MDDALRLIARVVPRAIKRRVRQQLEERFQVPSAEWSLENMRRLGFSPKAAVDVGAFKGEWSVAVRKVFPAASVLMLEAQESLRPDLEALKQAHPGRVDYRIALLGATNRDGVVFNEYATAPTASSVLVDQRGSPARKTHCRMRTLDDVLAEAGVAQPDLVKLDVQGYELEVLKGAGNRLQQIQAVMMEVSLLDLYQGNPLLAEVVEFMRGQGLVAYDISTLMRRPLDLALVQIDMTFVPANSPLRATKVYGVGDAI